MNSTRLIAILVFFTICMMVHPVCDLIAHVIRNWQRNKNRKHYNEKPCPHGFTDWDHCPDCRH